MATIDILRKTRIEKLEKLRKIGIDPFPAKISRKQKIIDARKMDDKNVSVAGRLLSFRDQGKIIFTDIFDGSSKIQVVFKSEKLGKNTRQLIPLLDIGDFISVEGKVGKTSSGEISVFADDIKIITKAVRPLPDKWYGLKDIEERYRKRYLDFLLNPTVRKTMFVRGGIIKAIRDFLNKRDYLEVETPTLQPVYGGGFAKPFVTHHNALDNDFYLRISDEMYLKRLIVGGYEKVYEITKVFRNEGFDRDHNPEFTMFEAQIAYQDYTYGMDIIEEIIEFVAKTVLGGTKFNYQGVEMDVKRPWARLTMVEAIKKYTGINPLEWKNVQEGKKSIDFLVKDPEKKKELPKMHTLGELIAYLFEEKVEEKLIQPAIIFDYPVEVSPLAKKCKDPGFTQRFEMFAFGSELGNNYSELNDPLELYKRFVQEKKREEDGFEEAHQTDYDYLEAIEHGFPPTCGIAIGIDRLVMLLTDSKNIKEVIPFPTLRPETKFPDNKLILQNPNKSADSKINKLILNREKAWKLLNDHMKNQNLVRHCLSVEAAMRSLAGHFSEDKELWGIVGLLHDGDYEEVKDKPELHTIKMAEWLKEAGETNEKLLSAILSHNFAHTGQNPPKNNLEWSLYCCDELTGFIVAVSLVKDKKLSNVTVGSVLNKFPVNSFAARVNRDQIRMCQEKLNLELSEFIDIVLKSMQKVHNELGL